MSTVKVDDQTFESEVLRSAEPVLVDFWAPWCGPCRMMAPQFEAAAKELVPTARLAKVNTQVHADATQRYGIRGIPALILFQNGQERGRIAGARASRDIVAFVQGHAQGHAAAKTA